MANNRLPSKSFFEIYIVTCLVTGKMYVGLTSAGVATRWNEGHVKAALLRGSNTVLARTIRKYGKDSFTLRVVDTAGSFEEAKQKEIAKIAELGTLAPQGMNATPGGEGVSVCIPEVINKIRVSVNALWKTESYVKKHADAMKAAVAKPAYKAARKKAAKEMWERAEYKDKQKVAFERTAAKRSESAKEMWKRPEYASKQNSKQRSELGRMAALKRWHPEEWEQKYGGH